jgi:hypothetical protein
VALGQSHGGLGNGTYHQLGGVVSPGSVLVSGFG